MSVSSAIGSAVAGLNLSARRAEVTSQNIANSLTEGYGRRDVAYSSGPRGLIIDGVTRAATPHLTADRRIVAAENGLAERRLDTLQRLENTIGTPDQNDSLTAKIAALQASLVTAGNAPSQTGRLLAVHDAMADVVSALQSGSRVLQTMRQEADAAIHGDINVLNTGLSQVAKLNADIARTRAVGASDASLIDARQTVIDRLSTIVSLKEVPRDNGAVALISTRGFVLLDGSAQALTFRQSPTIVAEMTLASTALSGISRGGENVGGDTGFGRLDGGSLEAAFMLRDHVLVDAQGQLDRTAFDLAVRFNDTATDPTIPASGVGLITDNGSAIQPANLTGMSARIGLNVLADPTQGGDLRLWRDGIGSQMAGPTGDGAQLFRFHDALSATRSDAVNTTPLSLPDRAAALSSNLSRARISAEQDVSFSSSRLLSLRSAEQAHGVDSDQELQSLLQIERSYTANARVLQAVNDMLQTILDI